MQFKEGFVFTLCRSCQDVELLGNVGVDTAMETGVLSQAAEGGTMQTSLEIRSKTEKWDVSSMGINTSTHLLHPLCL